jgi:hypothetical protein
MGRHYKEVKAKWIGFGGGLTEQPTFDEKGSDEPIDLAWWHEPVTSTADRPSPAMPRPMHATPSRSRRASRSSTILPIGALASSDLADNPGLVEATAA